LFLLVCFDVLVSFVASWVVLFVLTSTRRHSLIPSSPWCVSLSRWRPDKCSNGTQLPVLAFEKGLSPQISESVNALSMPVGIRSEVYASIGAFPIVWAASEQQRTPTKMSQAYTAASLDTTWRV
jgi:hypothetical protein